MTSGQSVVTSQSNVEVPQSIEQNELPEMEIQSRPSTSLECMSLSDNTKFYLERLDGPQIRLLEILPAEYNEPISCCFKCVDRTGPPTEYVALSYCWGDHADWERIFLNGSEGFLVTTHLYQGLRRLRHSRESRCVWIDAICINQADEQEKSHQVQQMDSIYRWAQRTVIWLGEMDASQSTCRRDRHGICTKPNLSAFEHQNSTVAIQRKLLEDEKRSRKEAHYMSVWYVPSVLNGTVGH